jgi:hypothetical protein
MRLVLRDQQRLVSSLSTHHALEALLLNFAPQSIMASTEKFETIPGNYHFYTRCITRPRNLAFLLKLSHRCKFTLTRESHLYVIAHRLTSLFSRRVGSPAPLGRRNSGVITVVSRRQSAGECMIIKIGQGTCC